MLSPVLGGRSEVLSTPLVESLGYVIDTLEERQRDAEAEQTKYYLEFISRLKAQKPESKKEQQDLKEFIDMIKPQDNNRIEEGQDWDFEALENFRKEVEGG